MLARARSIPFAARFWSKVEIRDPAACWDWAACRDGDGYGVFVSKHGKQCRAARAAWLLTKGEIPDGMVVCHRCDRPSCTNPTHLFLGTNQDNIDDMVRKGRHTLGSGKAFAVPATKRSRGEARPSARLTWAQVNEIRQRFAAGGVTKAALGREFGITATGIAHIINGKNWARPDLGNGCGPVALKMATA